MPGATSPIPAYDMSYSVAALPLWDNLLTNVVDVERVAAANMTRLPTLGAVDNEAPGWVWPAVIGAVALAALGLVFVLFRKGR